MAVREMTREEFKNLILALQEIAKEFKKEEGKNND